MLSAIQEHAGVLLIFTLLAVAMTYPLILHLSETVPGDFDTYWFLWNLWRFKAAWDGGSDLFHSNTIFYPSGTSLYLSTTVPLLSFVSIPLQNRFGLFAAYNFLFLLSYILSGYFMYLLARHVLRDSRAAFLAGLIFAFSPYHSAHAIWHLNLMSIEFIPLFLLLYLQFREKPNARSAFLAAFAFALVGYSEMIYLAMCLLYVLFDLGYCLLVQKACPSKRAFGWLAVFLGISFLLLALYAVPLLQEVLLVPYHPSSSLPFLVAYSPDLLSFLLPPWFNPFLSPYFDIVYPSLYHGNGGMKIEGTIYLGLSVLALIAYGWRQRGGTNLTKWKAFLILAFLFTLGPLPFIGGQLIPFLMPYFFAYFLLPVFAFLRVPARFDVLVMLAAGILAGYGYLRLRERLPNTFATFLPFLLSFLILFEFWAPPAAFIDPHASRFYAQLAADAPYPPGPTSPLPPSAYVLFDVPQELPAQFSYYNSRMLFVQTIHHKPIVGGALSRTPLYTSVFTEQPCVKNLATLNFSTPCTRAQYDAQLGSDIRYILYHSDAPDWIEYNRTVAPARLEALFGPPVFQDNELIVFCRFNCSEEG